MEFPMTLRPFRKNSAVSGNMLLIVLIGIALFAALMFALTRNNKYDTGASENAAIQAQEITSYADKINDAVQNVMMQNHCLVSQLSFHYLVGDGYGNASAPTNCMIFDPAGGGLIYQPPPAQTVDTASAAAAGSTLAGDYLFGDACVDNVGTGPTDDGTGPACTNQNTELLFFMPFVTQSVCSQINWITMKSTTIPVVNNQTISGGKFQGTFFGNQQIKTGSTTYPSGCYQSTNALGPGPGYQFYEVLVPR